MAPRRAVLALLAVVLLTGSAMAEEASLRVPPPPPGGLPPRPPRTVTVTGTGRVAVAPDSASFSVGVEATAKTVGAATAEANQKMKAVLDAVSAAGVAAKDVRTSRYDVTIERPWKDGKQQPISGYRVSTAADVKVRELSKLGKILDAVTAAGSNQLGALRMERLDPKPQQLEALTRAYADAKEKGSALAAAAGSPIGEVLAVSEEGVSPRPVPGLMMARAVSADAAPAPVSEGELEFVARVEVVFGLR